MTKRKKNGGDSIISSGPHVISNMPGDENNHMKFYVAIGMIGRKPVSRHCKEKGT